MSKNDKYKPQYRIDPDKVDRLLKLSNELLSSPTRIVNLLVDVGIEVLERSVEKLKEDVGKEINKRTGKNK